MPYKICVIPGDGIGPEVIDSSLEILKKTKLDFEFNFAEAGYETHQKHGTPLPESTIQKAKESDAILFGAVTTPPNIEGYFSPIVRLRKMLNLYANVRPIFSFPVEISKPNLDFTIIRENTEGLYSGSERRTDEGAITERIITKKGSERILKYAFELAKKQNKNKVTVVHKANVLRLTDGLFLETAKEISKDYPEIQMEEIIVDACAMKMILNPGSFEILVTTNMFGDILSDEASALIGGLGLASSANIGDRLGLFESVHGSAPDITGQNLANPTATILASTLMLEFLGENETANQIKQAVLNTLEDGFSTKDLGGNLSTNEFTEKVKEYLQN